MKPGISIYQTQSADDLPQAADVTSLERAGLRGLAVVTRPASSLLCNPPTWIDHDASEKRFFFGGRSPESFSMTYDFSRGILASLPEARLEGEGFIVITGTNHVLTNSYSNQEVLQKGDVFSAQHLKVANGPHTENIPFVLHRQIFKPERIKGSAILAADFWQFNYHHWMLECLPRLQFALDEPDIPVIVPTNRSAFQSESLQLLGIPEHRLLPHDGRALSLERLYYPSKGVFAPEEIAWLSKRLLKNAGAQQDPKNILYITRSDAKSRKLLNEDEIAGWLTRQGAEILTLTGMPLQEQIRRFAGARLIIGPHGSGLTNLVFAASKATILELMPSDKINHIFWLLANVKKQRYTFISGPTQSEHRDFTIKLDRVKKVIGQLLSE